MPSSASRMAARNSGVPGLAPVLRATGTAVTINWPASHIWPPNVLVEPAPCRSEEHTSELQSLMRISYAVFCLKKNININQQMQSTTKYIDHTRNMIKID